MANTVKWVVLSIICAIAAIFLYTTIDGEWAARTGMGIWMTISFFASATLAIVCVFNAVEARDKAAGEDQTEKTSSQQEAKSINIKKLEGLRS